MPIEQGGAHDTDQCITMQVVCDARYSAVPGVSLDRSRWWTGLGQVPEAM
jgi:hypothetical protein